MAVTAAAVNDDPDEPDLDEAIKHLRKLVDEFEQLARQEREGPMQIPSGMGDDLSNGEAGIGERLQLLWLALGYRTASAFAAKLGISPQRLSNSVKGNFLGKEVQRKIVEHCPSVNVDWIRYGITRGLTVDLMEKIEEARRKLPRRRRRK